MFRSYEYIRTPWDVVVVHYNSIVLNFLISHNQFPKNRVHNNLSNLFSVMRILNTLNHSRKMAHSPTIALGNDKNHENHPKTNGQIEDMSPGADTQSNLHHVSLTYHPCSFLDQINDGSGSGSGSGPHSDSKPDSSSKNGTSRVLGESTDRFLKLYESQNMDGGGGKLLPQPDWDGADARYNNHSADIGVWEGDAAHYDYDGADIGVWGGGAARYDNRGDGNVVSSKEYYRQKHATLAEQVQRRGLWAGP